MQILWAAARLKLQPPTAWVEAMVSPLLRSFNSSTPGRSGPAGGLHQLDTNLQQPLRSASSSVRPPLRSQGKHQQDRGLGGGNCVPQDLANTVFAVAQLGRKGAQRPHPQVSMYVGACVCLSVYVCERICVYVWSLVLAPLLCLQVSACWQ
jgi:hypothetical protein